MPLQTRILLPGPDPRSARTPDGQILRPPNDWVLVPPGDAALTRRIRDAGPTWSVQEKKGRKTFSRGVWAPASTVETIRAQLELERSSPQYAKKRQADAQRRERAQSAYVEDFTAAILQFLRFSPRYADLARTLAHAVAAHATPVGSGTVARTERIPIEGRAEAAVIAWMRHQTTAYDHMRIARIKGRRREVRRELAARSHALLARYRAGQDVDPAACPLCKAIKTITVEQQRVGV